MEAKVSSLLTQRRQNQQKTKKTHEKDPQIGDRHCDVHPRHELGSSDA